MASYHMRCKVISRGRGHSATAAAAYRAAERIYDRRTGLEHDYERKRGVVRSEVLLPRDAPELYRDRGELWNAAETRSNSRLSREFDLALPRELCRDEQWELARGWAERELVSRGMCADVCMHDRGDGNPHAFVMCTTREAGPDGFGAKNRDWNDKALLVDLRDRGIVRGVRHGLRRLRDQPLVVRIAADVARNKDHDFGNCSQLRQDPLSLFPARFPLAV